MINIICPPYVRRWHVADIPTAPIFVRNGVTADIGGFWREEVCPLRNSQRLEFLLTTTGAFAAEVETLQEHSRLARRFDRWTVVANRQRREVIRRCLRATESCFCP